MKKALPLLSLLLFALPVWIPDIRKNNLVVFASLSYYGSDFDGDGKNDLALWSPKTNTVYYETSSNKELFKRKFFTEEISYTPVFSDYDGDMKTDFGFFHGDSGQWTIFSSPEFKILQKTFLGSIGDLPIPTDLNGDGKYEPSIWRPTSNSWLLFDIDEEGNKHPKIFQEGQYQDSTFAGDYDGDKKSDLIVWRPDDGYWHIVKSSTGFDHSDSEHIQHGQEWDVIVPNDYDADGRTDLVFWRPQDQTWYFLYSGDNSKSKIKWGEKGDIPLSSDLDGDKYPELITWNRSKKTWSVFNFKKQESYNYPWENIPDDCIPANTILQKYE